MKVGQKSKTHHYVLKILQKGWDVFWGVWVGTGRFHVCWNVFYQVTLHETAFRGGTDLIILVLNRGVIKESIREIIKWNKWWRWKICCCCTPFHCILCQAKNCFLSVSVQIRSIACRERRKSNSSPIPT